MFEVKDIPVEEGVQSSIERRIVAVNKVHETDKWSNSGMSLQIVLLHENEESVECQEANSTTCIELSNR